MDAYSTSIEQPQSLFTSVMSYFVSTVHADADPHKGDEVDRVEPEQDEDKSSGDDAEEGGDAEGEEEEEEEPEDPSPAIRAECEKTKECAPAAHHFKECEEKVMGGKGWQGEDCVEELFHLMHCVDACAAPKLFKKLV